MYLVQILKLIYVCVFVIVVVVDGIVHMTCVFPIMFCSNVEIHICVFAIVIVADCTVHVIHCFQTHLVQILKFIYVCVFAIVIVADCTVHIRFMFLHSNASY